jgi:Zn-finger nucleic acid-binding protein
MSNIEPLIICVVCKIPGVKIEDYNRIAVYQCPKCLATWSTLTNTKVRKSK